MSEMKSLRQLYKKFGVILTRQQKAWAGVLFVMTVFGALFEALGVSAVMPLISVMIEPDTIRNSRAGEKVLAVLPEMSNEELMLLTAVGVIAVYIVKNAYMAVLCADQVFLQGAKRAVCQDYAFLYQERISIFSE